MPIGKYKGISIPKEMFDEIEKVIKEHPELGYSSITDFIKEAIREKIVKIKMLDLKDAELTPEEEEFLKKAKEGKIKPDFEIETNDIKF